MFSMQWDKEAVIDDQAVCLHSVLCVYYNHGGDGGGRYMKSGRGSLSVFHPDTREQLEM